MSQTNARQAGSAERLGTVQLLDVTKRFGEAVAVDRLTLDVHAGEFLSLLGPSGCGKTTTLRMLASFVSPAGTTTFPNYVFGLSGGVIRPEVAAMSAVFIGLTLLSSAAVAVVLRRNGQSGTEIAATFTGS
jgi:ABC-type transporter Mla maintaining outer membrane lipid asymmetry ATPase subunit MlaF